MSAALAIEPLERPPAAVVRVPGSKSLTNRALLCAALADGTTRIEGALDADDTEAMVDCLGSAGVTIGRDDGALVVDGVSRLGPATVTLDANQSGTTSRFLLPVLAACPGAWVLDGDEQLRARPFAPLIAAVRALGGDVREMAAPGCLPLAIGGGALAGGAVAITGAVTSQFVSALLLAGPLYASGVELEVHGAIVSAPYVAMTRDVMASFGVDVDGLRVPAGSRYRAPGTYAVEPDASAASYFFAAAAVTGGSVTVDGLGLGSRQGDVRFAADVLGRMGCRVDQRHDSTTVVGPAAGRLRGIDVDLASMPDMAQTLAAAAVFADAPSRVRGVAIIRGHETDRIAAVVTELRRLGIEAHEHDDGFTVVPGEPQPATVETYGDHRMAMAFTVIALRAKGIAIADPGCVAKTFPAFFETVALLR